jgi:hypothetical protein
MPLNTTLMNGFGLLQAYGGFELHDLFAAGSTSRVKAGRMTMDVGSRRLVARNRYRNTINNFNGLDAQWTSRSGHHGRLFAVLPVQRRPGNSERDALADNDVVFDHENPHALLWGAFYATPEMARGLRLEAYLIGLHERDDPDFASRNRSLFNPGMRFYRKPKRAQLDVEIESVVQVGRSRMSSQASDTRDLDHFAVFAHGALGYTFNAGWQPRLLLQWDYASGDGAPDDGDNGRFDTLFGARRFELGPTGIYGAFGRSNLHSPGLRFETKPHAIVDAQLASRPMWLASSRDTWTTSGVQDPSGASGAYLGTQAEARVRVHPFRGNHTIDVGVAHTWLGSFAKSAPGATGHGNPTVAYAALILEM